MTPPRDGIRRIGLAGIGAGALCCVAAAAALGWVGGASAVALLWVETWLALPLLLVSTALVAWSYVRVARRRA
jgi:Na+-transporting methylmalonyl-CoA/oxaloacetate decarboxylase beta subunit